MGEFVFDHELGRRRRMRAGIEYYPKLLVGVPFTPVTGARFLAAPGATSRRCADALAAVLEALCARAAASRRCT